MLRDSLRRLSQSGGVARFAALAILICAIAAALPLPVRAASPWWEYVGFAGQRVEMTGRDLRGIHVHVAGQDMVSSGRDGEWVAAPPPVVAPRTGTFVQAVPRALGGVVAVAFDGDGTAWRRGGDGKWAVCLITLPAYAGAGSPNITAVAAFEEVPLSEAVYVGTDGYGVLESVNGGDDWFRADPGLPSHVTSLVADDAHADLYAGTSDGLWVHHLQAQPAPPVYVDSARSLRLAGIVLTSLVAFAGGVAILRFTRRRSFGPRPSR